MSDRDRLSRPRLVSLWRRVTPGATVVVTAQHRSGVATSVREWLTESDLRLIVWSSNRVEVPADTPDADVVLLELEGMREDHVTATLAVRARWPSATLIAVTSTQWPSPLLDKGMRPERVFAGSIFGFTADEAIDRAEQLGLTLTWDEATALLDRVGSHAGFVDAVLRAAAVRGELDDAAVRAGCDEQSAHFAGSAAAGVFRPNGWRAALVSARIGPMPRRTLLSVWGRDEVVRAALDNVLQSGFFVEDLEQDTIELRPDLRIAFTARMEREVQIEQIDADVTELAARLLSNGEADDGWAIVAELPGARTRFLARHWRLLGEVDVARARPWLEEAVTRDPDPALRVALARTILDVTSMDHTGSISEADRRQAEALLDEVDDPDGDLGVVAAALRGVLLRLDGRFDEALATHEALADADREPASDPAHSIVRAGVLMQAALSAFDASRSDIASEWFSAAAALAHAAHDDRLARFAHDMLLIATPGGVPLPTSFQARIDGLVGAQAVSPSMRGIVAISSALYVVDPRALQEALDTTEVSAIDDPHTLRFVTVVLRSMAHSLLGTSSLALSRLELFEQELGGRDLARNPQTLLAWARAEALLDAESGEKAIAVLDDLPAAGTRTIPIDLLRARAYLRDREPARALACLAATGDAPGSGVLAVWSHVVLFLAYHDLGSESSIDVARSHLQAAIVAASRARPMLPFAMQGMGALNTTIAQASELTLDAAGRRLVADLETMRDGLQRATRSTDALSDRERAVVAELVRADSTKDLAARLHVSPNTVKTQLRSIYRKLGVSSWADAVSTARRLGLAK
ncbi:LuxR C-terminal-related transcriptional regulator [Microbacterium gubbeenense]|uniref:helix-turn-helix transcriptional regulator n=1 Tax=Microbacterium gubbeenense TaxID=159896 RepID=UPI003F946DC9